MSLAPTRGGGGDTETFPDILKIRIFPNRDAESCGLDMAHPTCTATVIRILVNPNDGSLCSRRGYRDHQCRRDNSRALRRDMPPAAWVISIVLFKLVTFNADRPFK